MTAFTSKPIFEGEFAIVFISFVSFHSTNIDGALSRWNQRRLEKKKDGKGSDADEDDQRRTSPG